MNDYEGTMRWFGKSFNAPMYEEMPEVPTPVGDECLGCCEPIEEGDIGITMPYLSDAEPRRVPFHIECHLRSALGGIAHQEKRCICFGGTDHEPPGGMTAREEAQEVTRRFWGENWKERA